MCDGNWEPLANFSITSNTRPTETIYCLTSRISFRNTDTHAVVVTEHASEEEIDRDYVGETLDLYKESYVEMQSMEKHDEEPLSCYCSASHTDNNYSTDEHDSVRDSVHRSAAHSLTQKVGLHQSDSGADLSEYHDQHEAKSIQNLLASYGKTFQASETDIAYDCKNVDIPIDYKHSSDDCITEVSPCNPASEKNKCCIDDSPSFTLNDRELLVQNLSDNTIVSSSTIILNRETNGEDYASLPQYNYPYSAYYETNKSAMDIAWEQFWAKNGEQIIWTSWIEKYADYINPDYLQNNLYMSENEKQNAEINDVAIEKCYDSTCFPNQAHTNCELVGSNFTGIFSKSNSNSSQFKPVFSSNTSFSFDQSSKQQSNDNDVEDSRKISTEIMQDGDNDGWNPLSPFSIEESYNQSSNAEDERLLTRCDSINGSIAKTNATSDSMTNVTKMTLTSSSCDSNSTHSSSLVSSFESSSIESNTTNSSSNQENELPMEDDKYWQQLWKEHFQLQYQQQYEVFIVNYKKEHRIDYDKMHESSEHVNENLTKDIESDHSDDRNIIQTEDIKPRRKISRSHRSNPKRFIWDSTGACVKNLLNCKNSQSETDENESLKHQTEAQMSTVTKAISKTETSQYNNDNSSSKYLSWRNSGKSERNESWRNQESYRNRELWRNDESCKNGGDGDKHENLVTVLKQSHEIDNDENGKDMESVKKAFSFLGFAFNEYHDIEWKGDVKFFSRKRNSRAKCQNKQWKTNYNRLNTHIYFDDNGKASLNPIDKVNKYLSYHPSSLSAEVNGQFNNKGSYAQCTSSSDEETDTSPKKLQSKRLGFNKRSTSPVESWQTDVNQEMEQYASDISYDDRLQHIEFGTLDNIDEQYDENNVKKTQKKKKKKQSRRNVNSGSMNVPPEIENDQTLLKYWYNRYHLFEKYDEGIQLDRESWYSVTPEVIAKHIAERCKSDLIIDAFCGAGGNAIQFAFTCERVIAIDIDPVKIELARNNARVYGVEDRIEFITGNFIELAPTLIADVVFMSPPWGGPEYKKEGKIFDLDSILPPFGGANLFKLAKKITNHVAYYLPKNIDTMQLITLTGDRHGLEIEQHLIGDRKLVALTAYYGELSKV